MEILRGCCTCYTEIFHLDQKHFQGGQEDGDPDFGGSTGLPLPGSGVQLLVELLQRSDLCVALAHRAHGFASIPRCSISSIRTDMFQLNIGDVQLS